MTKPNLHVIHETSLCDVPAKLRELAQSIENGVYGEIDCCAVATFGDELSIFGFGTDSKGLTAHCLFHAAAVKIAQGFINEGTE